MAGHGGIWLALCVYQYTVSMAAGQHGRKEGDILVYDIRYTNTVYNRHHQIPPPELRNARVRVSRVRVCALYYYIIIILLYYYIIIFIYTQYIQYIQYTKYTQYT